MTRRDEILEVLMDYAKSHLGNSPSERDLLCELKKRGYKMGRGTLQVHLLKLRVEGRIDRKDSKLIVIGSDWIPPEGEFSPIG
jgi:repressor of nif and glnA expression